VQAIENFDKSPISTNCLYKFHKQPVKNRDVVELVFRDSIDAFIDLDVKVAKRVLVLATKMGEYEERIEVSISNLLVLQQPIASDLRLVVSALKISTELQRIN
jgi:phosphate transport system protein